MHKATFLEGTLHLSIEPDGPILVKAGENGSADPTLPDMEFVRSRNQVYIPGSSLKGVVRAQCERICRSLDSQAQQDLRLRRRQALDQQSLQLLDRLIEQNVLSAEAKQEIKLPPATRLPLADNPLGSGKVYGGLEDMEFNAGRYIESIRDSFERHPECTAIIYRRSPLVSQIFGHTSLAGRVRFADAYASKPDQVKIEERNGVAIDRIYGSVAVGPFNYETVVAGCFTTRIDFKNVGLAQLGLLGLALRDLAEGRIGIGFGKSRGLGRVRINFDQLNIYYPTATLATDQRLCTLNEQELAPAGHLAGIGALCRDAAYRAYDFPAPEQDIAALPADLNYHALAPAAEQITDGLHIYADDLLGVRFLAQGNAAVRTVWRTCMGPWKQAVGL